MMNRDLSYLLLLERRMKVNECINDKLSSGGPC